MRTTVMFLVAMLAVVAIAAMSGCIDDAANDAGNVTGGDAGNGTNTTLVEVGDEYSGSEAEGRIDESRAKTEAVPEFEPEPEAAPTGRKDPNITVEMNETVNRSGLSVTCTMVTNYHYHDKGTDRRLEVSVRHIKLYVTIAATGGDEI